MSWIQVEADGFDGDVPATYFVVVTCCDAAKLLDPVEKAFNGDALLAYVGRTKAKNP